jgi:hypothetical protein
MISDAWSEEAQHLMPLPRLFDGFVEYAKRVSPTCLIHLDRNRYEPCRRPSPIARSACGSIPSGLSSPPRGRSSANTAESLPALTNERVRRPFSIGGTILAVIQRKPGALRNGAPFAELPPAFRTLQQRMLKTPGGDREMVEILALVLQHDEQAVLTAVELALEAGIPTKTHILNVLHRLVDGKPMDTPPIKAPQALTLTTEPQANVERYDALRKAREARHAS